MYQEHISDAHRLHPPRLQNLPEEERIGLQKTQILGPGNSDGFYISFFPPLLEWVISGLGRNQVIGLAFKTTWESSK